MIKIMFFKIRFPSNKERKQKWVQNLNKGDWKPTHTSRLCSDHFEECFIDRSGKNTILRFDAAPTRFKNVEEV